MSVLTQSFKQVMWGVGRRLGFNPDTDTTGWAIQLPILTEILNDASRLAWEYYPWPDAVEIGEETPMSHPTSTGAYYIPRSTSSRVLATVLQIWDTDPRAEARAQPVAYLELADGFYFSNTTARWVEYRPQAPEYTSQSWGTNVEYAVGDLVYVPPHVYRCHTAHTSAADFADTNWTVITVLDRLAPAIKQGVLSGSREVDGQTGRSRILGNDMLDLLQAEIRRCELSAGASLRSRNPLSSSTLLFS